MPLSSPVKPPRPVHAAHIRHEVQSFAVPDDSQVADLTLADFWKELDYRSDDFKNYHLSKPLERDSWRPKEDFGLYMNEISKKICDDYKLGVYLLKSLVV